MARGPAGGSSRTETAGSSEADFKVRLLAEAAETNRLLRRIDTGITALLRSSPGGEPYDAAFGGSQKVSAEEAAWLERQVGTAFIKLTNAELVSLAERLPPIQQDILKRADKYAVKLHLMRLMTEDRAMKPAAENAGASAVPRDRVSR